MKLSGLSFVDVSVPRMEKAPEKIMATLKMDYVYRHVESGSRTFQEWDDRVAYYSGTLTRQVPLFQRHEYVPGLYGIGQDGDPKELLKVRNPAGTDYPLQFREHGEASAFLDWLARELTDADGPAEGGPVTIGIWELRFEGKPLTRPQQGTGMPDEAGIALRVLPVYL